MNFYDFLKTTVLVYLIICGVLYFFQEKFIFLPQKLDKDYRFNFKEDYEEMFFTTSDGAVLNGLLFKAKNSKGLIFYLHGNSDSLATWGEVAPFFTGLNYDVFILDYRSFGKSEGKIRSQEQLFEDNQLVYDTLLERYDENKTIILGYSIGTGFAAKLASDNKPKSLILQAPYYSLSDLMKRKFYIVPTFLLNYKLDTNAYLQDCNMPITIFHGDEDETVYYGSSVKLKEVHGEKINLITMKGQLHNGITDNVTYREEIRKMLSE